MKPFLPYTHLSIMAKGQAIDKLRIQVVIELPEDSVVSKTIIGPVEDNIKYRPITIFFQGNSSTFKQFEFTFEIQRNQIGIMERGAKINLEQQNNQKKGESTYIKYVFPPK